MRTRLPFFFLLPFLLPIQAEDWLFLRGPNWNGTTDEALTSTQLNDSKIAWRVELGKGSSSVTVKGNRVFSMGNVDDHDVVYCLDAETGKEIWTRRYPCKFEARMWEGGTSATPTLDDAHVYAFSYDGQLVCLSQTDGSVVWRKHMLSDYGGKLSQWKYAGSPLILGKGLFLDIGGSGNSTVALRKSTGEKIWGSGSGKAGYAPVMPFRMGNQVALLTFKGKAMLGLEARTGKELFRIPWETSYDVNASSPVVVGSSFLVSSGYPKTGKATLYRMQSGTPKQVWINDDVKTKMSSCAYHDGHFYTVSEKRAQLMCIDARTGKTKWSETGGGQYGNLVIAKDRLVVLSDSGVLRIGKADPAGWQQESELSVLKGRCWVQPVVAQGQIYCRNNNGQLVCLKP